MNYSKKIIESILPGRWVNPPSEDWYVDSVAINKSQTETDFNADKKVMFIAIDTDTWHKGSGNRGIYAGWDDTHEKFIDFSDKVAGVIVNRELDIDPSIPQYVMENTYEAINLLGDYAYQEYKGNVIAITGTAGKSTTKSIFEHILSQTSSVIATRGNHNTRTGVPLTMATSITDPDHLVVEVAISSLWMRSGGIMKKYPPNIAIITSIDSGQQRSAHETAIQKSKIAEGMNHNGHVLLNRDMLEYDTVEQEVKNYNKNIITYGFSDESHVKIEGFTESLDGITGTINILGETVTFNSSLHGRGMAQNIAAVLIALKLSDVNLQDALPLLKNYEPNKSVQNIENHQTKSGESFTVINDAWNATPNSMMEGIEVLSSMAKNHQGKSIAVLGRIVNLGPEAKARHEAIAETLKQEKIDLVFGHGEEIKHTLKQLPETMIGGYFEKSSEMAERVANIVNADDVVLLKGSARATDFKHVRDNLVSALENKQESKIPSLNHPHASNYGAATFDMRTGKMVAQTGDIQAVQNQGVGGLIMMNAILDQIFAGKLELSNTYTPGATEIKGNQAPKSISLSRSDKVQLYQLLAAGLFNHSPNALLMLAHQVIGGNRKAMGVIQQEAKRLGVDLDACRNISGRRITNMNQALTLTNLLNVGKELFNKYPFVSDMLAMRTFHFKDKVLYTPTNLYTHGKINHGIFFGHQDSIGIVDTRHNGKQYISVVLGATDAYHRDQLLTRVIDTVVNPKSQKAPKPKVFKVNNKPFRMSIMGDTYFGEFYTEIRERKAQVDALQKETRNYSFDNLRPFLTKSDFNILNFEAAISHHTTNQLKTRKPFVLYSDPKETAASIKKENIHLVTLGNNHLMDMEEEGLRLTVESFNSVKIPSIGAGMTQEEAEKPYILNVNGIRTSIFNAYWHRNPMYKEFDFYAIGNKPGVASLSGGIMNKIREEKQQHPDGKVLVIAHWGVDFLDVNPMQRIYAQALVEAGADLIIGHGAHMAQEIAEIDGKKIVYSIGNGVFNSNGEYNRRHVAPYSMIAQLVFDDEVELRLYPFYSNNLKTFWQPRFLTETEFDHCTTILKSYGSIPLDIETEDELSYYRLKL